MHRPGACTRNKTARYGTHFEWLLAGGGREKEVEQRYHDPRQAFPICANGKWCGDSPTQENEIFCWSDMVIPISWTVLQQPFGATP